MENADYFKGQVQSLFPIHSHSFQVLLLSIFSVILMTLGFFNALVLSQSKTISLLISAFIAIEIQWITIILLEKYRKRQKHCYVALGFWLLLISGISVPFSGSTSAQIFGLLNYQNEESFSTSLEETKQAFETKLSVYQSLYNNALSMEQKAAVIRDNELDEGGTCDYDEGGEGTRWKVRRNDVEALKVHRHTFEKAYADLNAIYLDLAEVHRSEINPQAVNILISKANVLSVKESRQSYYDYLRSRYAKGESSIGFPKQDKYGIVKMTYVVCPSPWLAEAANMLPKQPEPRIQSIPVHVASTKNTGNALSMMENNFLLLTLQIEKLSLPAIAMLIIAWIVELITAYLVLTATYPTRKIETKNSAEFITCLLNGNRRSDRILMNVAKNSSAERLVLQLPDAEFIKQRNAKNGDEVVRVYALPANLLSRFIEKVAE